MMFLFLAACSERAPTPPPNTPISTVIASSPVNPDGSVVGSPPGNAPGASVPPATTLSPEETYKLCEARVEGPSTPGECTQDSDCAKAGCSTEVCVPAKKVGDIITTCEIQACFSVLSSCGCKDGMCSWTVAANARPMPRVFTPPELLVTPTPAAQ